MKNKNGEKKQSYILTKETLGMAVMLFCFVVMVILLTHNAVFGAFGGAICTFMYGTFGYGSFLVLAGLACLGFKLVFDKFPNIGIRSILVVAAAVYAAFLLFHAVSTRSFALNGFGEYISSCYNNAQSGFSGYTFGGVVSALLVFPVAKGTTFVGAYIIFSLILLACVYLAFRVIRKQRVGKVIAANEVEEQVEEEELPEENRNDPVDTLYSVNENYEIVKNNRQQPKTYAKVKSSEQDDNDEDKKRRILFEPGEFAAESYRRNLIFSESSYFNHPVHNKDDYLRSFSSGNSNANANKTPDSNTTYTSDYSENIEQSFADNSTPSYIYGDKPVDELIDNEPSVDDERSDSDYDSYTLNDKRLDYEQPQEQDYSESVNNFDSAQNAQPSPVEDVPTRRSRIDFDDVGAFGNNSETNALSETKQEEPARPAPERQSSNSFFDIFSASNPRMQGERHIEPDASGLESARRMRSRENIFDENDDEEEDNLFGDTGSLTSSGMRDSAIGRRSSDTVVPDNGTVGRRSSENVEPDSNNVSQMREPPARTVGFSAPKEEEKEESLPPQKQPTNVIKPVEPPKKEEVKPQPAPEKPKHVWKKYVRPSLSLLDDYPENNNVNTGEIEENKNIICETLESFRIVSQVSNVVVGPAITRYDVVIADKTNIKNALKYKEAIAMALKKDNVNAYLNYSKGAISIEVPNNSRTVVGLKSMLASSQFINSKKETLTFALGKNVEGQVVCPDITKMPHLLVAGTTGSGKSICLSALVVSLLYKYGPEELRFILVDPKQVEFISYDKLPHLMINEIIYDVDKAIKALNWAIKEMEDRYAKFKEMTEKGIATKNLTEYNAHLPEGEEKLPKIVIILDEFGDLMLQAKKEIEGRIIRLVQKARACGIHLILATQRPSVDCITGLIKSNLPTRIGFKVNSFDDARCIFDIGGAEKLLGKGDLYFRSAENPELARVQGCFIDTHEVQRVTDFVKKNNETYFDQTVSDFINTVEEPEETGSDDGVAGNTETKIDDTFIKALKFCVTSNQASVSMIQRRFPIGYMKACKIIDWMENMNYITQSEGSKPRKVLLSRDEFVRIFGDVDD